MKRFTAALAAIGFLLWMAPPALSQTSGTTKVVGTCGTASYSSGKMAYPTQDTTGAACSAITAGAITATTTATASAGPTAVVAGTGKPLNIGTANSALFIVPVVPGTTTTVDLTAPSGVLGANGSAIVSGTNPFNVQGGSAAAATQADIPVATGCRAASAAPTAVTDGQKVNLECGLEGRVVTAPYSIKEIQVRGSTGAITNTSQTSIIASAGGSLKNYITAIQCANSGASTSILTFTDAAATVLINPAGSGGSWTFQVPLATAAATAFQVTPGTSSTSQYCSAQGFTGL